MSRTAGSTDVSSRGLPGPLLGGVAEAGRHQRRGQVGRPRCSGWAGRCRSRPRRRRPRTPRRARRRTTTPGDRLAVDLGRDRDGEAGVAVDEVGGAVDRVDHPDARPSGLGRAAPSSPRTPSSGGPRADALHELGLDGPVDLGDQVGGRRLRLAGRRARSRPISRSRLPDRAPPPSSARSAQLGRVGPGHVRTLRACPAPDLPVDLRSDTVTRPTDAMRRAMAEAEVGDDGYGEDPTVRALEEAYAERVGKEAAVFVPSGTMANQIALRLLGRPGTAVVAGRRQHVVIYEDGAAGTNAATSVAPRRRRRRAPRPGRGPRGGRGGGPPLAAGQRGVRREHPHARGRAAVVARRARRGGRGRGGPAGPPRRRPAVQRRAATGVPAAARAGAATR